MIRVDFDPAKIPGSLFLSADDIKDAPALVVSLRNAGDPLSQYLRQQISEATRKFVDDYDETRPLPESLQRALIDELNQVMKDAALFHKDRFKGTQWPRETLLKGLIKQDPTGDDLVCLNRLLLEESFPKEIAKSPRAEWNGWTLLAR